MNYNFDAGQKKQGTELTSIEEGTRGQESEHLSNIWGICNKIRRQSSSRKEETFIGAPASRFQGLILQQKLLKMIL